MKRRTFFNLLGSATLGTIIALKLPETITPIKFGVERARITFVALLEAYQDSKKKGGVAPFKIVLNRIDYLDALIEAKKHMRFTYGTLDIDSQYNEFNFMEAKIVPSDIGIHSQLVKAFGFGEIEQGTIETVGKTYGSCGKYKFI